MGSKRFKYSSRSYSLAGRYRYHSFLLGVEVTTEKRSCYLWFYAPFRYRSEDEAKSVAILLAAHGGEFVTEYKKKTNQGPTTVTKMVRAAERKRVREEGEPRQPQAADEGRSSKRRRTRRRTGTQVVVRTPLTSCYRCDVLRTSILLVDVRQRVQCCD